MESNLLLEQYSWYKKQQLAKAPFECLLNADIEPNPHQVNAFCAAIQALKTGGIILADEVGLGKTIEAGLVLNYVLDNGAKKVLISLPATLRKQWEVELLEKFGRQAVILDRYTVEHDLANVQTHLGNADEVSIVIASYDYSSKLIKRFPHVKWDFLIIDEAHNLRNVFHGTKRAKNLYDLTHGIPKILLTATPLQNSLTDLHGLVSFIDPRIFGSEKVFNRRFVDGCDYEELKQELLPVLYRTLRRDVGKYMAFSKRTCITVDFHLSAEEKELYDVTNDFLRRDPLYSIPNANRGLIILVIRKLLASSSFALIETFEVLEKRLEKLYEGTKSAYAQEGFDLFWGFVEDEIDEDGFNEYDDEETAEKKQAIQAELKIVRHILEMARAIKTNAKIAALREALKSAFDHQISEGLNQKAVVFTESKRTQKYIAAELRRSGYSEEDILLFNGDFDDAMTKEIFRTWKVKNFGKTNYGRSVEYKHAIVDYFKSHAKILIVTDAGSEGLNLQFCNTIINYDLPWNPQKIEQRIGRCHRYGQTHDVVAINLLNTDNEADRRVYDILRRYVGVCAPGQSVKTALLRVYSIILQSAYNLSLDDEYKDVIDPYYTLVGYYNSIRELGGAVRLLQDDIPDRIQRIKKKYGMSRQRFLNHKVEITSRMSSYDIPKKLSQLETPYTDRNCLDTAIATNMIAVGMDVDRLGLMVVTGQPKQNSEYIQATSRIGRSYPGLVVTLYNPYRPRDLSHYENFTGYHAQLYRFVEGTTATPFSARARDRVLHALVISAIRLHYPEFASNDGAAAIDKLTDEQLNEVKALIMNRLNIIKPSAKADAEHEIDDFISNWKLLATQSKELRYYVYTTKTYNRLMNTYGEVCTDLEKPTLRSMRDVERAANMFYYTED